MIKTDRAAIDEARRTPAAPISAVVRVGAVKQLVEQEQQRRRSRGEIGELADAGDLRVEARSSLLQRVLDAQRRADASGERRSRSARTGAPASARTALTPTVRSSVLLPDMFEPLTTSSACGSRRRERDVVANHARRRNQRMTERVRRRRAAVAGCHRRCSGNGSSGCSYRYADSEASASNSPEMCEAIRGRAGRARGATPRSTSARCVPHSTAAASAAKIALCCQSCSSTSQCSRRMEADAATLRFASASVSDRCSDDESICRERFLLDPREHDRQHVEVARGLVGAVQRLRNLMPQRAARTRSPTKW